MKQRHHRAVRKGMASVSLLTLLTFLFPLHVLAATATIVAGQVTYPNSAGAANVRVEVHTPDGVFSANTTTNSAGNYTLTADNSQLTNNMSLVLEVQAPTGYNKPTNSPTNFTWTGTQYTTTNFQLVGAAKTITGFVRFANGQPAPQTDVMAYPATPKSSASTTTAADGSYTLNVTGGKWTVKADINLSNHNSTHLIADVAKQVEFADNQTSETESDVNFTATATTASVTAKFVNADGSDLTTSSFRADISIFRDDGIGTVRKVDANSALTSIGLIPGVYRMRAFHSDLHGKTFNPDDVTFVLKEGDVLNLGTIQAVVMDKTITGTLTKSETSERVSNQFITATNNATKERVNAQTDSNGAFSLTVGEGAWTLGLEVKTTTPYRFTTPATVLLGSSDLTESIDLVVEAMDQTLTGSITDEAGAVLENFIGNVVVEDQTSGEVFTAPIDFDGMYSVDIPRSLSGRTVNVGVQGAPDSNYGMTDFATAVVADSASKTLALQADNATIQGEVHDSTSGAIVAPSENEIIVIAVNDMGQIEKGPVGADGLYSLSVTPGDWNVSFQIQSDDSTLLDPVAGGSSVTAAANDTAEVNMIVQEKNATITGTVTDTDGAVVPLAPVVITNRPQLEASGEVFDVSDIVQVSVEADENGAYSAAVPAGDYIVLAGKTPDVSDRIQPTGVNVTVETNGSEAIDLQYNASNFTLEGMLDRGDQDFIFHEGGHVAAFTDSGKFVEATTDVLGLFDLALEKGETWKIVATYLDGETLLMSDISEYTPPTDSGMDSTDINVTDSGIVVPGPVTKSFDAATTASVALPDGGTVQLAPFAADTSGEITLTVTPTVDMKPSATGSPVSVLYDVNVQDADGVDVQRLNIPAKVTLPYNADILTTNNIEEGNTYIQFFGENSQVWQGAGMAAIVNPLDHTVTAYTTHLTPFAINGAPTAVSEITTPTLASSAEKHILLTPAMGGGPNVRVVQEDGKQVQTFMAYDANLRGGFEAKGADIDGDGTKEIVTVAGTGFGPHLRAFESDGEFIEGTFTFDTSSRAGTALAVGDLDGDGDDEVITAQLRGATSVARVYAFDAANDEWDRWDEQMIYDAGYKNGIQMTTLDVDGDGSAEIAFAPTDGSGNVQVYDVVNEKLDRLTWFVAHAGSNRGVSLASADLDGNGDDELVTIPHMGEATMKAWDYNAEDEEFMLKGEADVYQSSFKSGVQLAVGDVDGDGADEVTVAPLDNGGPNIRTYSFVNDEFELDDWILAYHPTYRGGVNIAMADMDGNGTDELITAPQFPYSPNVRVYALTDGEYKLMHWFWGFASGFHGGVNLGTL